MFFALGRLLLVLLVVGTVLYVPLWFYARSVQKDRLERRWDEDGRPGALDTYVADGLASQSLALRRKLLLGVYVVPFVVVSVIIYVTNYS